MQGELPRGAGVGLPSWKLELAEDGSGYELVAGDAGAAKFAKRTEVCRRARFKTEGSPRYEAGRRP
jgi:hypothetical protein